MRNTVAVKGDIEMRRRTRGTHRTSDRATVELAKRLRKNKTEAELLLWERLRRKAVDGFRFRQQHPIGPYIADFYCDEAGLVIEVDGGVHRGNAQRIKDRLRDIAMEKHSLLVLRFENRDIAEDIDNVLETIRAALRQRAR